MMPKMDGNKMSRQLKNDERTSHIPIIMLTAKATIEDKIEGLETGVDEYLFKPFEARELRARIKNLLDQRKRLHEHFRKYGLFETDNRNITPLDTQFMQRFVEIINKNLSNNELSIDFVVEKMSVSRSVLKKKISVLTGDSPAELIKRIRLSAAAKLIEQASGNISEIALEVGFTNPAYFSECFRKQFGISPSQYHQTINKL
jgi:YesN/AraC family two-component response regulator